MAWEYRLILDVILAYCKMPKEDKDSKNDKMQSCTPELCFSLKKDWFEFVHSRWLNFRAHFVRLNNVIAELNEAVIQLNIGQILSKAKSVARLLVRLARWNKQLKRVSVIAEFNPLLDAIKGLGSYASNYVEKELAKIKFLKEKFESLALGEIAEIKESIFLPFHIDNDTILKELEMLNLEIPIFNKDNITINFEGGDFQDTGETIYIQIYCNNKSDKKIKLSMDNIRINGVRYVDNDSWCEFIEGESKWEWYALDSSNYGIIRKIQFRIGINDENGNKLYNLSEMIIVCDSLEKLFAVKVLE